MARRIAVIAEHRNIAQNHPVLGWVGLSRGGHGLSLYWDSDGPTYMGDAKSYRIITNMGRLPLNPGKDVDDKEHDRLIAIQDDFIHRCEITHIKKYVFPHIITHSSDLSEYEYGYISPDGDCFGCEYSGHNHLAQTLVAEFYNTYVPLHAAYTFIDEKAWICIRPSQLTLDGDLSVAQISGLSKWFVSIGGTLDLINDLRDSYLHAASLPGAIIRFMNRQHSRRTFLNIVKKLTNSVSN